MDQPIDAIRVSHLKLQAFVREAARAVNIPEEQAELLTQLLIASDLRGVHSHGSRQIVRYVREIRRGGINPRPRVRVVQETNNSTLVDGDWGLGYFPAYEGTLRTIEKARRHGMAALVTRHHGHIGAAGIYARMTLEHDLLTFVTSGVQLALTPGELVVRAAGGSPMAFSAPGVNEPPLVLDCGVTHDIQGNPPHREAIARLAPGVVLRAIGFGTVCQAWGGLLSGLTVDKPADASFADANQGAMLFTFRIDLFADVDQFKREIDCYAQATRQLKPLENTSGAWLPGGIEAEREQVNLRDGVPLGREHRLALETLASELQLAVPW